MFHPSDPTQLTRDADVSVGVAIENATQDAWANGAGAATPDDQLLRLPVQVKTCSTGSHTSPAMSSFTANKEHKWSKAYEGMLVVCYSYLEGYVVVAPASEFEGITPGRYLNECMRHIERMG